MVVGVAEPAVVISKCSYIFPFNKIYICYKYNIINENMQEFFLSY